MNDDFPEMPTRRCPDCKREKKLMFFSSPGATYCRECTRARNGAHVMRNLVPADAAFNLDAPIRREQTR